jgi:hypothetical protein
MLHDDDDGFQRETTLEDFVKPGKEFNRLSHYAALGCRTEHDARFLSRLLMSVRIYGVSDAPATPGMAERFFRLADAGMAVAT